VSVFIIAEIGLEHRGQVSRAKRLIDDMVAASADAVKFQLFYPEEVGEVVWNNIKDFDLTCDELIQLKDHAEMQGVTWLCSAFGVKSLRRLSEIAVEVVKIPSPCLTNRRILSVAGELFTKVILSTGLHGFLEIRDAVRFLHDWLGYERMVILQCTSAYPCPLNAVNLRFIQTLGLEFNKSLVGISDHSTGTVVPVAATALGAEVIEKHVTLDRHNGGPDACCSLEPLEFKAMVQAVRDTEKALGDGIKKIEDLERKLLWRKQ